MSIRILTFFVGMIAVRECSRLFDAFLLAILEQP